MQEDTNVSPINPLPPVVAALFIMMIGIEVVFALGARGIIGDSNALGWRVAAVETYGFNGQILDWMLVNRVYPVEHLIRFVAFLFVHASFTHALFVGIMVLALGKMVGEVFSPIATLTIFLMSGVFGAAAYGYVLNEPHWLIGGFPGGVWPDRRIHLFAVDTFACSWQKPAARIFVDWGLDGHPTAVWRAIRGLVRLAG